MQGDIQFKIHDYIIMQYPKLFKKNRNKKMDHPPASPWQMFRNSGVFQANNSGA